MNNKMEAPITKDELKEVLAGFKNSKSLGSDGWTMEFYIGFYDLLEEEILRVVEESRFLVESRELSMQPLFL
jgi:hypothetical protein